MNKVYMTPIQHFQIRIQRPNLSLRMRYLFLKFLSSRCIQWLSSSIKQSKNSIQTMRRSFLWRQNEFSTIGNRTLRIMRSTLGKSSNMEKTISSLWTIDPSWEFNNIQSESRILILEPSCIWHQFHIQTILRWRRTSLI